MTQTGNEKLAVADIAWHHHPAARSCVRAAWMEAAAGRRLEFSQLTRRHVLKVSKLARRPALASLHPLAAQHALLFDRGKGAGSPVSVILSPRALRVDNCRRLARARPIATPGALMPQC